MHRVSIVTVTLHGAMDLYLDVPTLHPGQVQESVHSGLFPAGKGLNVARTVSALGSRVSAVVLVGADFAQRFRDESNELLEVRCVESQPETRINVTIHESDRSTHIRSSSTEIAESANHSLASEISEGLPDSRWFALSGSLPRGMDEKSFKDLLTELKSTQRWLGIDSSGSALRAALEVGVDFMKPNLREVSELLDRQIETVEDAAWAAKHLAGSSGSSVMVSMGTHGAILAEKGSCWRAYVADPVQPINVVGAGDALMGGYLAAKASGDAVLNCLKCGVAAATASLFTFRPGDLDRERYEAVLAHLRVEEL